MKKDTSISKRESSIAKESKERADDRKYYESLSYLASMPFHHMLSAEKIYSYVINKTEYKKLPSVFDRKFSRLRFLQEASADQYIEGTEPITLNKFIQISSSWTNSDGDEVKQFWDVLFLDELQGCAEIYRAEMLIFKRLIYEEQEKPETPFRLTNEKFPRYLNYEIFNALTEDVEGLLVHSLAADYCSEIRIIPKASDKGKGLKLKKRNKNLTKSKNEYFSLLMNRISFRRYYTETLDFDDDRDSHDLNNNGIEKEIRVFLLDLNTYWDVWRIAARTARLDFDLMESLADAISIRFYELTKMLRVSLYNEVTGLPIDLTIDYERFALLMPVPKFNSSAEREKQIKKIIAPLVEKGYIKSFFFQIGGERNHVLDKMIFQFSN